MSAQVILQALHDETIYSLVARLSLVNGLRADKACVYFLGTKDELRIADANVNFETFNRTVRNSYGLTEDILHNFTNVPFRHLISTPLLNGANSNKWWRHAHASKVTLIELSNHEEHVWKWCPICLENDIQEIGFTYWRLTHQLPGVFVCAPHLTSLNQVTIPFRRRQKEFLFPHALPLDLVVHSSCDEVSAYEMALQLGLVSQKMMWINERLEQEIFRATIKDGLMQKQFVSTSGELSKEGMLALQKFYEPMYCIKPVFEVLKPSVLQKQIKLLILNSEITLKRALLIPMLILWLFEDWQFFLNAYSWQNVMYQTGNKLPFKTVDINKFPLEYHRGKCQKFVLENPELNKQHFWKQFPKSCRWLKRNDNDWFVSVMPRTKAKKYFQLRLIPSYT